MAGIHLSISFPLRVAIYPANDVEGQWIAHCLETDLVTQGDSVEHALEMAAEALDAVAKFNTSHDRFPVTLTPAPREIWALVNLEKPSGITANVEIKYRKKKRDQKLPDSLPIYAFVSKQGPQFRDAV
jgi:predicted RNase H-like HicB family nuclease